MPMVTVKMELNLSYDPEKMTKQEAVEQFMAPLRSSGLIDVNYAFRPLPSAAVQHQDAPRILSRRKKAQEAGPAIT